MSTSPTPTELADRLEEEQLRELGERMIMKPAFYHLCDGEQSLGVPPNRGPMRRPLLMGDDPRLPEMPAAPTLLDFFRYRFAPQQQHLLQSARLARENGLVRPGETGFAIEFDDGPAAAPLDYAEIEAEAERSLLQRFWDFLSGRDLVPDE